MNSDLTTIDALSRQELLRLVAVLEKKIAPSDIALARWLAASDEFKRLCDLIVPLQRARNEACLAHTARPSSLSALERYQEARLEHLRAELASSRAWARSCRLYDAYQVLYAEEAAA